ncbi:hypothetical protein DNHGIG_14680 [Collibacillus ludicampi]|uniref:Uncharacterized protein n=2 Tax=Collibacillus ludicampi TaxID=2771369 RepID=A0AAV4LE35_9BACL|nr:hypothetical protein DNHGIG_14680 [Collibacillus ludicampi]
MENLIPVVTYDPTIPYVAGILQQQENQLRPTYGTIAFRIFHQHHAQALNEIASCIRDGDIVLYDIDEQHHQNAVIRQTYPLIHQTLANVSIKTVLIRSAIPRDLYNTHLSHGSIVPQADNGLLTDYSQLGFDAFGDYVGIKKDDLTDGGRISPGFIFYSWQSNAYYGYNGIPGQLATFDTVITPSVVNSTVWNQFGATHRENCFGCNKIYRINNSIESGQNQAKWKGIAFGHYLYTMEEFL